MDQKKSHNITPKADEVKPGKRPLASDRLKQQERERAALSPDRGKKKPTKKEGPLSVGVDMNPAQS